MRKFLTLLMFILSFSIFSRIGVCYTPPPFYSVNFTLETPYTPPPFYSVNFTLGPTIRYVQQHINCSDSIIKISNINRQASSDIQTTIIFSGKQFLTKKEYFTLNFSTFLNKISTLSRDITQPLTFTGLTERIVFLLKILTQPTTFTGIVERVSITSREITQSLSFTGLTTKLRNLFEPFTDLIGITETTEKTVIYIRKPTLILALSESSIIVLPKILYNISIYTQEYAPGDEVYIYAMIPELIKNPHIIIYYPNMTKYIEDNMNYFERNIFYYTLTAPNIKGDYLVKVTAGNSTAINTFRVSSAYIEGGGIGIEIFTTGDYLYYPGTTAKIPFTIVSRTNGEPIDYDSIKITIYSPNMTKIAERTTANKISKGIYYIDYNISSLADYGVYPVVINATSGSYYTTRLTSFKVLPAGPLDISITPLKTEVQQGEDLPVKLRIKNLGEGRTITYTYRIYSANNTYYTETSSLTLNRYEDKQLIKTIPLPITADTGIATLELNVSYSPSEPSIYNTNFVTITYSPRGYTPKILTITFNLTPERQYLTILRNNDTIFSGIIHNRDTMQLSEGKYKFIFTAEGYFKKTAEIYLDRDLIITSKLSSATIPILFAENIYKIILILLIVACIIIFYKFRFLF